MTLIKKPEFIQGQKTTEAQDRVNALMGNKPADYQSKYSPQMEQLLNNVVNRKAFSYDASVDPMYNQMKEQYVSLGKNAMRDVQGQSAALSGGYGNTYGVTAGAHAYNDYLGKLNNMMPELYGRAADQYNAQGQQMLANLGALQGQDDREYGQYRDKVGDYDRDLNFAYNQYNDYYNQDYGKHQDQLGQFNADRDYDANQAKWQQEQANYQNEWAYKVGQSTGGKSAGGGKKAVEFPYLKDVQKNAGQLYANGGDEAAFKYIEQASKAGLLDEREALNTLALIGIDANKLGTSTNKKTGETKGSTGGGGVKYRTFY